MDVPGLNPGPRVQKAYVDAHIIINLRKRLGAEQIGQTSLTNFFFFQFQYVYGSYIEKRHISNPNNIKESIYKMNTNI